MRKQTKLAVGLAAAALLVIGASMTSFASGWTQEGDDWYYLDSNGDPVTDKWKSYNGTYFYLGSDGAMITNELIDDGSNYYYVDANGAMVKNTWVAIAADDDEEYDVDYRWYYFGNSGKAYTDSLKKTINGKKYGFDEDGKMLFGFVDENGQILNDDSDDPILECKYYYGTNDDGAMVTGWLRYEDGFNTDTYDGDDYEYYWFWFKSNGEKFTAGGDGAKAKKINGSYYAFDDNGVMLVDWAQVVDTAGSVASSENYKYFSGSIEDGSLKKNAWIWAEAPEDWYIYATGGDEDPHWYRTTNTGELVANQTKKINSKWYVFDEYGVMRYGLVLLDDANVKNGKLTYNPDLVGEFSLNIDQDAISADDLSKYLGAEEFLHYFSSDEEGDGSMKTGTNIKLDLADDTYTFAFDKTTGAAYEGYKSKKAYLAGMLQSAGSDKYAIKYMGHNDDDSVEVLVNSSGTVMTSTTKYYKDADENYYVIKGGDTTDGFKIRVYDDVDAAKAALGK